MFITLFDTTQQVLYIDLQMIIFLVKTLWKINVFNKLGISQLHKHTFFLENFYNTVLSI